MNIRILLYSMCCVLTASSFPISDVAFSEKYFYGNFHEIFRKISGNFLLNRKNVFIHNVSVKTAENTGKVLVSF